MPSFDSRCRHRAVPRCSGPQLERALIVLAVLVGVTDSRARADMARSAEFGRADPKGRDRGERRFTGFFGVQRSMSPYRRRCPRECGIGITIGGRIQGHETLVQSTPMAVHR